MEITAKVKTYEFCKALLSFLSYLYGILHLIILLSILHHYHHS